MEDLIEVTIKESAPDAATGQFRVILQDRGNGRILTIWVGQYEGNAIALGLEEVWTPRPMTHDLAVSILQNLKATINRVVITDLKENTFYAEVCLTHAGKKLSIDSRPSDAIAMAVRVRCPIFITKKLSEKMTDELDEIFESLQPQETIH